MPVPSGSAPPSWLTKPVCSRTCCGCLATSKPETLAVPESMGSRVVSMRKVVVFPAPFGPRNPKISPGRTLILTPRTASTGPRRERKLFFRSDVVMTASGTRSA